MIFDPKTDLKTVIITGHTCSGKTTLLNKLVELGYLKVVTYTTRPMREGEIDGVDYHFLSEDLFQTCVDTGYFFESVEYVIDGKTYRYGSSFQVGHQSKRNNRVIILDPRGVIKALDTYGTKPFFVVWLDIPQEICVERALARGDKPKEINDRITADAYEFDKLRSIIHSGIRILVKTPVDELIKEVDMLVRGDGAV